MTVNVLIVDDDNTIRDLLRAALSVEDNIGEVRAASGGRAAVEACSEFTPDVVVLDYDMPGKDGSATADELRELHPAARIIAYSGMLERKPEWADDYYVKGDLPDLAAILESS